MSNIFKGILCGIAIGWASYTLVIFALRIWIDSQ